MPEVIPFRGILYNTSKVSGGDAVAPPYDIITPELRTALYEKSSYNIVRVDSGEEYSGDDESKNKYIRASRYLNDWLKESILIRSQKPCFYAYEMDYITEGRTKKLRGFFGLVRLVELDKGVYPHEATHSKPKIDRLNLMSACEANTSPIFSIYNSPEKKAARVIENITMTEPYMEAKDINNVFHRLWLIKDEKDINIIADDMSNRDIIIADGHHRYETALEYQRIMRERSIYTESCDYVLMFLANIAEGNLTILPTHRVIRHAQKNILDKLAGYFDIKTIPVNDDIIEIIKGATQTIGLYQRGDNKQYLLRYRGDGLEGIHPALKGLDVTILQELILKKLLAVSEVFYEMDASAAKASVQGGHYDAAFFLNPTRVEDVERVAFSSMRMPPKSTYFYPKVMTGFVINSFKNSI